MSRSPGKVSFKYSSHLSINHILIQIANIYHVFQFVYLAAMSLSGSLMPSVPVQVLLKFAPPKLTIVYHFENKENDQYYHDIHFDRSMLQNESEEDIVSHLFLSEAYYFNPKQLKRHQVSAYFIDSHQ